MKKIFTIPLLAITFIGCGQEAINDRVAMSNDKLMNDSVATSISAATSNDKVMSEKIYGLEKAHSTSTKFSKCSEKMNVIPLNSYQTWPASTYYPIIGYLNGSDEYPFQIGTPKEWGDLRFGKDLPCSQIKAVLSMDYGFRQDVFFEIPKSITEKLKEFEITSSRESLKANLRSFNSLGPDNLATLGEHSFQSNIVCGEDVEYRCKKDNAECNIEDLNVQVIFPKNNCKLILEDQPFALYPEGIVSISLEAELIRKTEPATDGSYKLDFVWSNVKWQDSN
jgi:hypothetical protein